MSGPAAPRTRRPRSRGWPRGRGWRDPPSARPRSPAAAAPAGSAAGPTRTRCAACPRGVGTICGQFEAEKVANQRPDRVLPLATPEVENEGLVRRNALGSCLPDELFDEPRLPDAGFAAHMDCVPAGLGAARLEKAAKLCEFGLAPDE